MKGDSNNVKRNSLNQKRSQSTTHQNRKNNEEFPRKMNSQQINGNQQLISNSNYKGINPFKTNKNSKKLHYYTNYDEELNNELHNITQQELPNLGYSSVSKSYLKTFKSHKVKAASSNNFNNYSNLSL